jgi:hypothetical protein
VEVAAGAVVAVVEEASQRVAVAQAAAAQEAEFSANNSPVRRL